MSRVTRRACEARREKPDVASSTVSTIEAARVSVTDTDTTKVTTTSSSIAVAIGRDERPPEAAPPPGLGPQRSIVFSEVWQFDLQAPSGNVSQPDL